MSEKNVALTGADGRPVQFSTKKDIFKEALPPVKDEVPPVLATTPAPAPATPDEAKDPLTFLKEVFPDAPSPEQIAQWKARFGGVYMLPLSEDEVYVWRPMKRTEWKSLMTDLKAAKAGNPNLEIQEIMDERICEKCVLWPDIGADWAAFSKAGTVPTLAEAIRESSNFVPLDIAMRLVRRLG